MQYFKKHRISYSVMILSALSFILIYGTNILNVTYTDWLLCGGDHSQHYLGWKFFRCAPWQWYIGMMNNIAYPYSESVIFTDSIPLLAVFFKIFSGILPKSFQYFGLWGLLCFILQGYLASLILRRYLERDLHVIIGSLFFVFAPILLRRMYWHTSLGGQWLILLALVLFLYHDEWSESSGRTAGVWGLMGALCASIHIYFLPMCGVILFGFVCIDFWKRRKLLRALAPVATYAMGAIFVVWWLGGLISGMDNGAPGLGYYSFNLAGFWNTQEWSFFFPQMKNYADGQYEGFAYLGLGFCVLLVFTLLAMLQYFFSEQLYQREQLRRVCREHIQIGICILMGLLSIAMAASQEVSFGSKLLYKIPIPHAIEELWAVFRASGRLVWPAVYLLMIFLIVTGARGVAHLDRKYPTFPKRGLKTTSTVVTLVLGISLIFQIVDLHEQLRNKHNEFAPIQIHSSELESPFWEQAVMERDIQHIVFADKEHMSQEQLYSFADFASEHGITINDFYFARALTHPIEEVADDFMKHPNQNTLYIFTEEAREQSKAYDFVYYLEDGFIIGVTDAFFF